MSELHRWTITLELEDGVAGVRIMETHNESSVFVRSEDVTSLWQVLKGIDEEMRWLLRDRAGAPRVVEP
jgi:hypothetical protein